MPARARAQPVGRAAPLQVAQRLAGSRGAIPRQFGECLAQHVRAVAGDRERLQPVDAQLAPRCADAAPEGRYEGRRLQECQKLRLPGSRMPEYMVERVGGCLGMHRDHRRPRQHQFRSGGEERLPYRAGGHAGFQEIDRRPACVELRNLAEHADELIARGIVPTALFPGLRNLSQHHLERPPGPVGRQVAGGGIRTVAVILECGCQRAKQGTGVFGPDKR